MKMELILAQIEAEKTRLAEGVLFRWLSNETVDGARRLSFAPSMLYYLMGFKDVLAALYRNEANTPLELSINSYCGEDAEHWRWYLADLETLGYSLSSWGKAIPDFCNEVWSPATEINRTTIFKLISYAEANRNPLYAMCLIFVFEATGVIFIGHTRKAAQAMGMDERLAYFGRIHYEEEFGHSVQAHQLSAMELDDNIFPLAERMVSDLFNMYEKLFTCWYENRGRYSCSGSKELFTTETGRARV
jgi:hypothetical protein